MKLKFQSNMHIFEYYLVAFTYILFIKIISNDVQYCISTVLCFPPTLDDSVPPYPDKDRIETDIQLFSSKWYKGKKMDI